MRAFAAFTVAALAVALAGCGEGGAPAAEPSASVEGAAVAQPAPEPAPAPAKPADAVPPPASAAPAAAAPGPAAAAQVADVVRLLLPGARKGPVSFPHRMHTGLPIVGGRCDVCHHTSDEKGTGAGKCTAAGCHDGATAGVRGGKDAFHDKCRGCHKKAIAAQPDNEKLKRVQGCKGCHAG